MHNDTNTEIVYKLYTDGSYRDGQATWAFAIIQDPDDELIYEESGFVQDEDAVKSIWNIAGELEAAIKGIDWAISNDKEIILISDYSGIKGWAEGWSTKTKWSTDYSKFVRKNKKYISEFIIVKGHSKNKWNDYVDKLAFERLNSKEENNNE